MEKNAKIEDMTVDMGGVCGAPASTGTRPAGFCRKLSTLLLWMNAQKRTGFQQEAGPKNRPQGQISYIGESQNHPPYMGVSFLMFQRKSQQLSSLVHSFTRLSTVYRGLSTVFENLFHMRKIGYPHRYGVFLGQKIDFLCELR